MAEWRFRRDTAFRKTFFVPESFSHPAKMDAQLLIKIVEDYTKVGEVILDPMAGSGTTLLACTMGRNVILVELEEKFCKMCRDNWEQVKMRPQLGFQMGECQIIQGDARNLEGLLADKIITSPPYADISHSQGDSKMQKDIIEKKHTWAGQEYSDNPNNLGNLPYGDIDKIITSPPYAIPKTTRGSLNAQEGKVYQDKRKGRAGTGWEFSGQEELGHPAPNNIANLPYGNIDTVITSPPYAETSDRHAWSDEFRRQAEKKHHRTYTKASFRDEKCGNSEGQISNLSYGDIDAVITSPPYENQIHKGTGQWSEKESGYVAGVNIGKDYTANERNIGNLKSQSYLEAMLQVYRRCFAVLKDGGLLILVTKNFIRNKQVVKLDTDTIKLCEQAGFSYLHRHWRKLPAQSFWRILYQKKHPEVEQINYEDILVFKK